MLFSVTFLAKISDDDVKKAAGITDCNLLYNVHLSETEL